MRVLVAFMLVLAGCVAQTPDGPARGPDTSWSLNALLFGGEHDHADPSHHENLTTPNFEVLGFAPWTSDNYGGSSGGGYLCGDAQEVADGRRLAAVESRSDVAFGIADVTDPGQPRILGEFVMEHTYIYDLAVVLDGRHVAIVTAGTDNLPVPVYALPGVPSPDAASGDGSSTGGGADGAGQAASTERRAEDRGDHAEGLGSSAAEPRLTWRSPCTDGEAVPVRAEQTGAAPYPMNLILVDITDPAAPAIVDIQPLTGHGHSIFPYRQDGHDILLVASGSDVGAVARTDEYSMWTVEDTPAGSRLVLLSRYDPAEGDTDSLATYRRHDGWVAPHPATGVLTMYLAGGPWLTTFDVTDPSAPQRLGRWDWPTDGILHGAYPLPELWGGRHYTVVGPEYCSRPEHTPSGVVYVLDTTDPAAPHAVAAWTLPHDVEWDGCYMFSNHYFTVVDQTLFMSMYHGGVWAIDLSPVRDDPDTFHNLPSIGVFLPADGSLPPAAQPVRWAPTIEEVLAMPDGTLVTFDGNYGIYTLRFDESAPMPAPDPWPLESFHDFTTNHNG